jgi:hypothetical protein
VSVGTRVPEYIRWADDPRKAIGGITGFLPLYNEMFEQRKAIVKYLKRSLVFRGKKAKGSVQK